MSKSGLFVRESSGLRKEVSMIDAVMLNLGNMSAGLALFTSITPYVKPGTVLWLASVIGFLLAIPQAYFYTHLSQRMPRTGGDYIWISRILGGQLGFTMALALNIESLAYFALTAYFAGGAITSTLTTIGALNHQSYLVSLGNYLSSPLLSYAIGAVVFGVIIAFNILRAKWGYSLVSVLGFLSIASFIVADLVIALSIPSFHQRISPFLNAFNLPANPSYNGPNFSWFSTLYMLPFLALYTYPWMQAGPAVASEFRGRRVVKYNIFVSLILTFVLVTLGYFLIYAAGGYGFTTYQFMNNGFTYTFWTVAMALAGNPALEWFIGIGLTAWEFMILAYGAIVFSRYIFAMSFDRVLPEIFSRVTKRGSPVYTHLLDLGITLSLLVIPVVSTDGALALYGAIILATLYFAVVSVGAAVYSVRQRIYSVLIASVISSLYFAYLTYEAAVNPDFGFVTSNGSVNPITFWFVIGTLVFSALIYAAAHFYNRSKGIDLALLYKEIPPE
jgi:amino acid transporter